MNQFKKKLSSSDGESTSLIPHLKMITLLSKRASCKVYCLVLLGVLSLTRTLNNLPYTRIPE